MDAFDWKAFLSQWAEQLLRRAKESGEVEVPPDVLQSNWLGFPGATEAQLQRAEARLGTNLPRSYRDFLKTTNGWRQVDDWMPASAGHFLSAEEINWYPAKQPALFKIWKEYTNSHGGPLPVPDNEYFVYGPGQAPFNARYEYLETCLAISERGDAAICLLNPNIVINEGEWEAWFDASWHAGAVRYRSFREMMEDHYRFFLEHPDWLSF